MLFLIENHSKVSSSALDALICIHLMRVGVPPVWRRPIEGQMRGGSTMIGRCGWRVSMAIANPLFSFTQDCSRGSLARRCERRVEWSPEHERQAESCRRFSPLVRAKTVLQALVSLATRPEQTGRNVWSNSDGYPLGTQSVIEPNLVAACGVLRMILRQKALDHAIEALTRVRVCSFEADDRVDCGSALVASKCTPTPNAPSGSDFDFNCHVCSID